MRKPLLKLRLQGIFIVLGGSWVVICGVISPLIWVITIVILLITLLTTNHEPPSWNCGGKAWWRPLLVGSMKTKHGINGSFRQ